MCFKLTKNTVILIFKCQYITLCTIKFIHITHDMYTLDKLYKKC